MALPVAAFRAFAGPLLAAASLSREDTYTWQDAEMSAGTGRETQLPPAAGPMGTPVCLALTGFDSLQGSRNNLRHWASEDCGLVERGHPDV